jgi:hypothetical protein
VALVPVLGRLENKALAAEVVEVLLLPEMLAAGVEALEECRKKELDQANTCVAVFLAMRAVEQMALEDRQPEVLH